jgi:hypothetical protein
MPVLRSIRDTGLADLATGDCHRPGTFRFRGAGHPGCSGGGRARGDGGCAAEMIKLLKI